MLEVLDTYFFKPTPRPTPSEMAMAAMIPMTLRISLRDLLRAILWERHDDRGVCWASFV